MLILNYKHVRTAGFRVQLDLAILSLKTNSKEKVITLRVGESNESCVIPFIIMAKMGSLFRWVDGNPFIVCANFIAARYVRIEDGFNFQIVAHQMAKCLHVAWENG